MGQTICGNCAATFVIVARLAAGQSHAPIPTDLQFEVASLKLSRSDERGGGIRPAGEGWRYEAVNCPLKLMIQVAYRVKAEQIVGAPGWLDSDRFDMNAKAERQSNSDELHIMLMNLLADRFHLRFHKETKEMSIYALTVDKSGTKMTPHEVGNAGEVWIEQSVENMVKVKMKATFAPMDYFAFRLSQMMDRPTVDMTNLKGGYDFALEYTRDLPMGISPNAQLNGAPIDTSGPNVFEAVKRQLGLELHPQRGAADVIVIDHIEILTEN